MSPGPAKQFDRDEVLERAMQLFWAEGYEATGMTRILEHVGIGRQSLYDTFGDKRSLMLECLDHYFRTRVAPFVATLKAPGSPMGNIRAVFSQWEEMAEKGAPGCMVGNTCAELGRSDPEVAKRLAGYFTALEDGFCDALGRAQQAGELQAEADPRDLARVIVHVVQGVALLSKVFRDSGRAREVIRSSFSMLQSA